MTKNGNNMKCKKIRTLFNLFEVFDCKNCRHNLEDEHFLIGHYYVSIYHLFNQCEVLGINYDDLIYNSKKLKFLLKDAISYNDKIFLIFIENFQIETYFEIFERILDNDLNIQIITY